jgi:hypothetical protein
LATALLLVTTPTARGQQTTTSTRRIPVTKDRPTRPAPAPAAAPVATQRVNQDSINAVAERARQDSIAAAERNKQLAQQQQARRDSVRLAAAEQARQDSIAAADAARQDSIARAQSRAQSNNALQIARRYNSGFYMAIAGGSTMPMRMMKTNANNSYDMGWNVTVPFGWDFSRIPLGIRFDLAMDNLMGKANFLDVGGNPTTASNLAIYSASAGLKLNVPLFRTASRFYLIGGGGAHRVTGYATSLVGADSAQTISKAKTDPGFYAGAGFNFRFGRTALFLESRYINVAVKRPVGFPYDNANYIPVVLGVEF